MKGLIPYRMGEELSHQANFILVSISSDCLYRRCCQMMNLVPDVRMADAGRVTQDCWSPLQLKTVTTRHQKNSGTYLHNLVKAFT